MGVLSEYDAKRNAMVYNNFAFRCGMLPVFFDYFLRETRAYSSQDTANLIQVYISARRILGLIGSLRRAEFLIKKEKTIYAFSPNASQLLRVRSFFKKVSRLQSKYI